MSRTGEGIEISPDRGCKGGVRTLTSGRRVWRKVLTGLGCGGVRENLYICEV